MRALGAVLCLLGAAFIFIAAGLYLAFSIFLSKAGVPEDGSTVVVLFICAVLCIGLISGGVVLLRADTRRMALPPMPRRDEP